jgi:hypothetical protein
MFSKAALGISMNLITIRSPSRVCWSDACPFGLGGYSATGRAWRIRIPASSPIFGNPTVNNLLKFLGMAINIWLECESSTEPLQCILALGDNTSAIGWLFASSKFASSSHAHRAHLLVSQQLATVLLQHDHCLASQHLKEELNAVADLLSFVGSDRSKPHPLAHGHPSDSVLTQRFHEHLPTQIPANFVISRLPKKILSWVAVVLQTHESYLMDDKKAQTRPTTKAGADGPASAPKRASLLTPSSLLYPNRKLPSLPKPLCRAFETPNGIPAVNLLAVLNDQWWQALCAKPQAVERNLFVRSPHYCFVTIA